MPRFTFFCLFVIVHIATCQDEKSYDLKYDNVDIDEILKSERLLTNYINCLMEKGPCTEDGRDLKEILPDSIQTDCSKCTEKQKEGSDKIMHFIIEYRPNDWTCLEQKYDQSGKYRYAYLKAKDISEHDYNDEKELGQLKNIKQQSERR